MSTTLWIVVAVVVVGLVYWFFLRGKKSAAPAPMPPAQPTPPVQPPQQPGQPQM
jgi:hypothetical protein